MGVVSTQGRGHQMGLGLHVELVASLSPLLLLSLLFVNIVVLYVVPLLHCCWLPVVTAYGNCRAVVLWLIFVNILTNNVSRYFFPSNRLSIYLVLRSRSMWTRCWWQHYLIVGFLDGGESFKWWDFVTCLAQMNAFCCPDCFGVCWICHHCFTCHPWRWRTCSHPWKSPWICCLWILVQDGGEFLECLVVVELGLCVLWYDGLQLVENFLCCLQGSVGFANVWNQTVLWVQLARACLEVGTPFLSLEVEKMIV